MTVSQPLGSDPEPDGSRSINRTFLAILSIGLLMGITLTSLAGYLLWAFGVINVGEATCPQAEGGACPPTALFVPELETPTPSPTSIITIGTAVPAVVTVVPDAGATATAACDVFQSQFPGTPCPAP